MSKTLVIGITGPSGAGKGLLSECCARRGVPVIDADRVYHSLLKPPSPCLDELTERFGADILTPQGTLDRAVLAARVFSNSDTAAKDREDLNRISHRFVSEHIEAWLTDRKKAGTPAVVIDAPLLIEAGLDQKCDTVIAVLAGSDTRLARLLSRDQTSRQRLQSRMDAQPDDDFYKQYADVVIQNDGVLSLLQEQADKILSDMGGAL